MSEPRPDAVDRGGGERFVIIHGHFYQPPRENPWTEEIEVQDSAAPYHDWNARITAECYGPCSASRLVGDSGGVIDIINNYAKISFNAGPTLLAYLERHAPGVYRKIVDADRQSAAERGGHGNAIAQPYNHTILPLMPLRDRRTQVRWGIRDFERRFGRGPRGMWLPECAVDEETLGVLCDYGLAFTVLGPGQARRFRKDPDGDWQTGVDPRRPYRVLLADGRSIVVFFYDGGVSHDIAFGAALRDRDAYVERIYAAFGADDPGARLVSVATDGETYGHHRPFGDMVLSATLARLESEGRIRLTNYAQFLEMHPPDHVVELVSPSSWSCPHGVARWQDDCGCTSNAQPGWHQRWRRPLKNALDDLGDRLATLYERRGGDLFADPWAVRDAYIDVILDRTPERVDAFLAEHAHAPLSPAEQSEALKLLEVQRHALLMFTSCGWFFGDISGPEAVQVLRYAARAMQLAQEVGDPEGGARLWPAFQLALTRAPSNLPEQGDGGRILAERVRPSMASLSRIAAHYALSLLFEPYPTRGRIFCYRYEADDVVRRSHGATQLAVGRVKLSSAITRDTAHATFAMLHFGGHDARCAIGMLADLPSYEEMKADLAREYEGRSVGDVVRAVDRYFPGRHYGLSDLFLDERRRIVRVLVEDTLERHRGQLTVVFEQNRPLLRFLAHADTPVPPLLAAAADYSLSVRFAQLVAEAEAGASRFDAATGELLHVVEEARELGARLDVAGAKRILETRILDEAHALRVAPRAETARALLTYLELAEDLALGPDTWEAQNLYWTLTLEGPRGPRLSSGSTTADGELMVRLGVRLGFDARSLEPTWRALPATGT